MSKSGEYSDCDDGEAYSIGKPSDCIKVPTKFWGFASTILCGVVDTHIL